ITSVYDLLKHLDQIPAKITILELIRKSKAHQDIVLDFFRKIFVNENILPERIISTLFSYNNGPLITFSDEELAPYELRSLPLCIEFGHNGTMVNSTLIDTGASVNIFPLSTMKLCGINESQMNPTPTTVAAYDNSRRPCYGTIDIKMVF